MKNRILFLLAVAKFYREQIALYIAVALCLFGMFVLPAIGHAAEQKGLDFNQCAKSATAYGKNPFALSMAELDELRLCITWQMAAPGREAQDAKEARAIERNFGKPLVDAE